MLYLHNIAIGNFTSVRAFALAKGVPFGWI